MSSPNKQPGGSYNSDTNQYGMSRSNAEHSSRLSEGYNTENELRTGTDSFQSVNSLAECEPLLTSTPKPSEERLDGRFVSLTQMLHQQDSFCPVSDTDSEASHLDRHQYSQNDPASITSSRKSTPLNQTDGTYQSSPGALQNFTNPPSTHYPSRIDRSLSTPNGEHPRETLPRNDLRHKTRSGPVHSPQGSFQNEEEEQLKNQNCSSGLHSKPIGPPLGIKSSLMAFVSPTDLLKQKIKSQTGSMKKVGINGGQKVSPLALISGEMVGQNSAFQQVRSANPEGCTKCVDEKKSSGKECDSLTASECLLACTTPSEQLQKRVTFNKQNIPDRAQYCSSSSPSNRQTPNVSMNDRPALPGYTGYGAGNDYKNDHTLTIPHQHAKQAENTTRDEPRMETDNDSAAGNHERSLTSDHLSYTTPSELLHKTQHNDLDNQKDLIGRLSYATPSDMLRNTQRNDQDNQKDLIGRLSYATPSDMLRNTQHNDQDNQKDLIGHLSYATPSDMLRQAQRNDQNNQKDLIGRLSYATPSDMLRQTQNNDLDTQKDLIGQLSYATPSDLLRKTEQQDRKKAKETSVKNLGYCEFSFTSPSQLLEKATSRRADTPMPPEYGQHSNTTQSQQAPNGISQQEQSHGSSNSFHVTQSTPGYTFFRKSSSDMQGKKPKDSSPCVGYGSPVDHTTSHASKAQSLGSSVDCSGYGSYEDSLTSSQESFQRRLLDWEVQSDITLYFNQISDVFHQAACLSMSISEPWFMRLFLGAAASSMYETSQVEESSFEDLTSGLSSTGVSKVDFLDELRRYLHLSSSFGCSDTTFSPMGSSTDYGRSDMTLGSQYADETEEQKSVRLATSDSFNHLFWSLYNMDPKLAITTIGSDISLLPPQFRKLNQSNYSSSTLSSSTSSNRWRDIADFVDNEIKNMEGNETENYYEDETEDQRSVRLASSRSFNKLFLTLYTMDPKLAMTAIGSDLSLLPPPFRKLSQSNFSSSTLSSSSSRWREMADFVDNEIKSEDGQKKKSASMSGLSSAEIRTMQLEKESLESQVRKLKLENSTLFGDNKLFKQKLDSATARIADLEERLHTSKDALDTLERNVNIEISEVCRRNRQELELHLQELETKLNSSNRENDVLKTENVSLEKQVSGVKKEAEYLRTSGDKNKTLEAYMRESELLTSEVEKLKELLRESETRVHELAMRQSDSNNQLTQICKVRDMLQQQLQNGGSVAEKQSLREMKDDFESKIRQMEEKLEDIRSEKQSVEQIYKEQLSTLTKERHNAFGKLKTLTDMMDAIRTENEALRQSLKSGRIKENDNLINETEANRLNMEVRNLEDIVGELNRTVKQQTMELESVRAQLNSRNKSLNDANAELSLLTSRLSLDDTNIRKQQKIDRLTSQVNSLQSEMKKLTEKCGILGAENSRFEQQLDSANRQLTTAQQKHDSKGNEQSMLKISYLESELEEKSSQVEKVNTHYKQTESSLQQIRQELYYHQEHSTNLQSQVDSYHHQLDQKVKLIDTITKSEKEKLNQIEVLKDALDSMTSRLNNKQAALQIAELELSQLKDINDKLQVQINTSKHPPPKRSPSATELQISQLKADIDKLKSELLKLTSLLNSSSAENEEIQKQLSKVRQQLSEEKSKAVQISAEKLELEQQIKSIGEERDVLFEEKTLDEEDLVKLERKLQEVLHRFEEETLSGSTKQKYNLATLDNEQLLSEISKLTLLLDGKDRELEMFNDKQRRNNIEMTFLHRRVEYLANENQCNKEDIDRLTNELIFKMKENSATYEVNEYLAKEKAYQQKEVLHLQKDLQSEKDYTQKMKGEINSVLKKIDESELGQQSSLAEMMSKDGKIAALENEIRHMETSTRQLENHLVQNKSHVDQLNDDIKNLTNIKSTLENQLADERRALDKEKSLTDKKKDEVEDTYQKLDAVKHEQSFLLNNLSAERRNLQLLKEEIVEKGLVEHRLNMQIEDLKRENTKLQLQITDNSSIMTQIKKDQTVSSREHSDLSSMLREKDREISELREREMVVNETIRREVAAEKSTFDQEKSVIARDLQMAKDDITVMTEKVQQKDLQLNSFGRTLQELEETNRKKRELESKMEKLESSISDSKLLIESQRKEVMSLRQENSKLHESFAKSQVNSHTLQDELRLIKESTNQQLTEVKHSSAYQKDQNEAEKYVLREALAKSEANLRATEATLHTLTESKITLHNDNKMLEHKLNELKTQYTSETTERRLAEQRADNLKSNLDELKHNKLFVDEKIVEIQGLLSKSEGDINAQKEKLKKLNHRNQELEAMVQVNDSTVRAKQEQIDLLQAEISKMKQTMDVQKQQLNTKLRKFTLEQKLLLENIQQEKQNLSQQAMQLSVDLEQAREQIAVKNKENLKFQEDILGLEEQKREMNSELRLSRDSLKSEEVMQTKLVTKFTEQEEELKKLRAMWAKQGEEDDPQTMWKKMNQVIQNLSLQMQNNLDSQQVKEKEAKDRENKVVHRYKKQNLELQSQLNTEKALHQITKNSLKALEEDCARLRQLMHSVRRKSASPDKKQKSRIEEINEIIVRSQTQAQSMMASGSYLDTTLKHISPSRDYNINSNRDGAHSPDTSSQLSDCSFGSATGVNTSFLNVSGTYFPNTLTPRK